LLDRAGLDGRPYMTCAGKEVSGDDFAYDLVAGNDSRIARREFAFYDVQVGAAYTAGEHTEQNVARLGGGSRDVLDVERRLGDRGRGSEDSGFHTTILGVWEDAKRSCIIEPSGEVIL
jgi:hypothetical protein